MKLINGIGYLNKKEVIDGIKKLPNAQDKFIILAIYNGIAGKNYKHLLELKKKDIDLGNGIIKINKNEFKMDSDFREVAKKTLEEVDYRVLFPSNHTKNEYMLNTDSEYLITSKPTLKNKFGLEGMKYGGFRTRFATIKNFLGWDELTTNSLETSYVIEELLNKKNNWTVQEITGELYKKNSSLTPYRIYNLMKEF